MLVDNVVAGLLSGFFVTFCVLVLGKIWKAILIPWFEELVYKDVNIEGRWYSLYHRNIELRKETIDVKRHGHKVTGTITCVTEYDLGETYEFSGSFRNMILPICYETTDKSKSDRGTITLKCIWNAEKLDGVTACYSDIRDKISVMPVMWFRSREDLMKFEDSIKAERSRILELQKKQEELTKQIECIEKTGQEKTDCTNDSATKTAQQEDTAEVSDSPKHG